MAIVNDLAGSASYGVPTVTIDSVEFVAENFDVTNPSDVYEQKDNNGEYTGCVMVKGAITGSCTLQLRNNTLPVVGDALTCSVISGTFKVTEVGQTYSNDSEHKVNISFRQTSSNV